MFKHFTEKATPCTSLLNSLNSAIKLLEPEQESQLCLDVRSICEHLANPNLRVTVFGPFNHGKSTLLNALLGSYALPIDLVPTTGAAISIKYGEQLQTRITFLNGTKEIEHGTEILQRFAILDGDRRMRDDVASVEVLCPHPLLKNGTELLDLPGTNDREEQDKLVRNQLLTADLVIQVLDARKLFTLKEVEDLRDWLIERGIKTVIFVINFLNLLDIEDQKEVIKRASSIAEDFRLDLPDGLSNLHRVDALPALKARLRGDTEAAYNSGILTFESALHNILAVLSEQIDGIRFPRVVAIAQQVKESLEAQSEEIKSELQEYDYERKQEIYWGKQEEKRLKQAFEGSVQNLMDWLSPESFIQRYQSECLQALLEDKLTEWLNNTLHSALAERVDAADRWVNEARETFGWDEPEEIVLSLPDFPEIDLPSPPSELDEPSGAGWAALAGGVAGSIFGPWGTAAGAAWAYGATQEAAKKRREELEVNYRSQVLSACNSAIEEYLRNFSYAILLKMPDYRRTTKGIFEFQEPEESLEIISRRRFLKQLESAFSDLDECLE
ncbi:dynamin family protein [Microcoleus sp. herbarium14]|uniref:dynamin family protein n=1 Tax=Microcoleus sp. herbarium14 TaxID=3055439 RepID=UPI002FD3F859